jgi:hypothetical protein
MAFASLGSLPGCDVVVCDLYASYELRGKFTSASAGAALDGSTAEFELRRDGRLLILPSTRTSIALAPIASTTLGTDGEFLIYLHVAQGGTPTADRERCISPSLGDFPDEIIVRVTLGDETVEQSVPIRVEAITPVDSGFARIDVATIVIPE